jgi:uroporphyrinogen-III synthase
MHLLVTRPEPDAAELKTRLEALGHRVSLAPLLSVETVLDEPVDLKGARGLVVTSRNSLKVLEGTPQLAGAFELPVFAVGPGCGSLARAMGFVTVLEGPAAARDLVALVEAHARPVEGPLLHLTGERRAFDLKGALEARGFEVREKIVYRTVPAAALPESVAQDVAEAAIDAVLLMSPRTAEVFVELIAAAGLVAEARRLVYMCLSQGVAEPLRRLGPIHIEMARRPNLDELIEAVILLTARSA